MKHQGGGLILLSIVAALCLNVVPLPQELAWFRPDFMAMVLIYWTIALPHRVGVGIGWCTGLLQDVLKGALLGQYALVYALQAYLAFNLHHRLRVFPLWQQAFTVVVLVGLGQCIMFWIERLAGQVNADWRYWMSSFVCFFAWPLLFPLLRRIRRQYKIS